MATAVYASDITYKGKTIGEISDNLGTIREALRSCIGDTEQIQEAVDNIEALLLGGYFQKEVV